MKLATFIAGGAPQLGAIDGEVIVALRDIAPDMISLIANWPELEPKVRETLLAKDTAHALGAVRLAAPIARPSKIMCMGLNYLDHIEESGIEAPADQTWFVKTANTVNGPFDPIPLPIASDKLDYEVELVAVIGKRGKHIARENASRHVFGYAIGNDVSVRDWQLRTSQFVVGKSFDGHAPWGPWITTSDEVSDPHALDIRCVVNGELRQHSNTKHLLFNVWDMIAHLSQAMTLEPGDIIFTGTPGGVGWTMNPPRTLKPGDIVRCEIDGLGAIEGAITSER